jgi:hypothetical protein
MGAVASRSQHGNSHTGGAWSPPRICAGCGSITGSSAATDLGAAAARLESEHGLRASGGGEHEGLGPHNRIVPLGGGYLEILAVADPWLGGVRLPVRVVECAPAIRAVGFGGRVLR